MPSPSGSCRSTRMAAYGVVATFVIASSAVIATSVRNPSLFSLSQRTTAALGSSSHSKRLRFELGDGRAGILIASSQIWSSTRKIVPNIADKNSERLVRQINDVLDIEKMESGQVVFDLKRVEVKSLVEQAIEANRGFAEGHNVRLRLSPASVAASVRADPDRLMQV